MDAESDEALPLLGSVLDERFAIDQVLGQGGMGCVFLARHLELEQPVAIKLLRPGRADGARGALRLLREARASARIKSEHVVRVLDVVSRQKAAPYIVMEYLEGRDLARHLAQQGPMLVRQAANVVAQACEAVAEGHRLGIVHRDLKPSNIFLCEGKAAGHLVKVLDFGISKSEDENAEQLTHSHALLGSPVYAAPEQLQSSHSVDARADIWSLGVVLYECVTGQRPFSGSNLAHVCTQILQGHPVPLERYCADLPSGFRSLVLRCLEKAPADRYASVEELLRALAPFAPEAASSSLSYLDGLSVLPRPSRPPISPSPRNAGPETLTGSAEYDTRGAQARRDAKYRVRWSSWVVMAVVSLIAIGVYSRLGVSRNYSSQLSAALPAQSPPPAVSVSTQQHGLPSSVATNARTPAPVAPPGPPSSAKSSAPVGSTRKTTHPSTVPATSSSPPWVESR